MKRLWSLTRLSAVFWEHAILSCVAFLFCAAATAGNNPASAFESANRLYEKGAYAEAAAAYQAIIASGQVSAPLYFNLGNSFFKSGQTGQAIAAYRHATALSPRDPDIEANLRFARNQVSGPTWQISRGERWLKKLSLNEWTAATMAALWLTLGLLTLRYLQPAWKPVLRGWIMTAATAAALLLLLLSVDLYQSHSITSAVVTTSNAAVRFGPIEESANAFLAQNGAELRVLDRKDNWLQVAADSRRIGWIRANEVTLTPGP